MSETIFYQRVNRSFNSTLVKFYFLACILNWVFLTIDHYYIYNEKIYISERKLEKSSAEKIISLKEGFKMRFIKDLAIIPIIVFIQITLITLCLYIGIVLKDFKIPFGFVAETVSKAMIVFPIFDVLIALILVFTRKIETFNDTQKPDWHNLMAFFDQATVQKWFVYPLRTVNMTEFVFIGIVTYLFNRQYGKNTLPTIILSYFIGLSFWVLFIVFFQLTQSFK